MKLDFVIIGGQKCGSTYLHHIINEHPEIELVPGESPEFESPDYENGGLNILEKKISKLNNNKLIGIKRPSYLCLEEVPERLFKLNKNLKVITILRNPIDRFKSSYFHQINNGFGPILDLNQGTEKLLNGNLSETHPRTKEIINYGLYSIHLKRYHSLFKDNFLILTFDDLRDCRDEVIKTCYEFLNVDVNYIPHKEINKRPQKVTYTIPRIRLLVKANKYRYIYNRDKTRLFYKKQSVFDTISYAIIKGFDKYFFSHFFANKKPMFSEQNKKKLLDIYRDDILETENILKKDLTQWRT